MQKKLHVKKNDQVVVIAGEDKGRTGRVLEINRKTERATVEGVNIISVHSKPTAANPEGGIVKKEGFIHVSNLLHADPKDGKPCRVGTRIDEAGKKVRFSKRSGEVIK